jgi:putative transposase
MPRRPRFAITDVPLHVVQRGNARRPCFFSEADYRVYLKLLTELSCKHDVLVHAFVLMTNHVHLLVTPRVVGGVSKLMQSLGSRYVKYVNGHLERCGTLWESRYKACLVACDQHVLAASRYIDLNPVRAGIVQHPADYRWSSYGAIAGYRHDVLVVPHPALQQLGAPGTIAYARWCEQAIEEDELKGLREATRLELAFGSEQFKTEIAAATSRATTRRRPGPRQVRRAGER